MRVFVCLNDANKDNIDTQSIERSRDIRNQVYDFG